jgi:hypothetical protein
MALMLIDLAPTMRAGNHDAAMQTAVSRLLFASRTHL